ncbi:sulfotransferase family protein [Halieaceae bacterium IMCC14734]|uniref:Sulfotransferase family protein n=1 Tax=Candidatus Litorirhabdus singularis TaxID=2518993 RepID=A0ABT3TE83_9GAMM|nr:tetratricopeptide repeat-containing sulfotransferase family protein [Candidatus Litorirhabdus singularis]MCX2980601.1 sulfotransferase family protein [Candidatus Litorirhabdus singularis]
MTLTRKLPNGVLPLPEEPIVARTVTKPRRLSPQQALALANKHQSNGELRQSWSILQKLLADKPDMHAALHLGAIVKHQLGDFESGIALLGKTVLLQPEVSLYRSNLAEMYRTAGNTPAAIEQGREAVRLDPASAVAHSNLGIAYYDMGDFEAAESCQHRALQLNPDLAAARNNLGSIFRERKDLPAAIRCYEMVLRLQPEHLEAMNNLGAVLTEDERYEEAVATLRKVLAVKPDFADAHSNIGNAFVALEKYEIALQAFDRALELRPEYAEPYLGRARVFHEQGQLQLAEEAANSALLIDAGKAEAHCVLALVYAEQGSPEKAMQQWEQALSIDPALQRAYIGKGSLLMEQGLMKEAESSQLQALELDSDSLAARIALTQVRKTLPGDENFLELEARVRDIDGLYESKAMALHFALGKCYDDLGDYNSAFPHFLSACAIKRRSIEYSPADTETLVDQLISFFDVERVSSAVGGGCSSELPVFVLGMARSGTTLTEQIIASHPQVYGAGELPDLLALAHSHDNPQSECYYPFSLSETDQAGFAEMGASYVSGLHERFGQALRITDKMPANFFAVGLIHLILPHAKIIHIRRNPLDTCISGFSKLYNRGQLYSYDLAELGQYYRQYYRLMQHWTAVLPAGRLLEICYEDLVADQEMQARRIIEHCGLEWTDRCLDFHKTKRSVRTASAAQVRQPIYTSSIERWRRYEKFLQPLCDALGPDLIEQG